MGHVKRASISTMMLSVTQIRSRDVGFESQPANAGGRIKLCHYPDFNARRRWRFTVRIYSSSRSDEEAAPWERKRFG